MAGVQLTCAACPGFVEFVERGETDSDQVYVLAERLLAPIREAKVDTLLLGLHPLSLPGPDHQRRRRARRGAGELGRRDRLRAARRPRRDRAQPRGERPGVPGSGSPRGTRRRSAGLVAGCSVRRSTGSRPGIPRDDGVTGLRADGREPDDLRRVELIRDYTEFAAGSVLIRMGKTTVLCTASVADEVPRWLRNSGRGWVTAEYSMLPGSSPERIEREAARGRQSGRTQEIQRLIGRALRAVTDLEAMAGGPDHPRLRRAASRRGYPHGQHLRRLCGPARRLYPADPGWGGSRLTRCGKPARRCRSGSSTPCPCSTWPTARTARPRWT